KTLAEQFGIARQITFTFELRAVAHVDLFGAKNGPAMIVFIEDLIQSLDIARALIVYRGSEFNQLFNPRLYLADELARNLALARLAEQAVLLFYYLVVSRKGIQKSRTAGYRTSIDEPAALSGIPADHIHLFE